MKKIKDELESGLQKDFGIKDFENLLGNLEAVVKKLESGECSLEESLKSYEEGVKLYKNCQEIISSAEKKVLDLNTLLLTSQNK